MRTIIQSVIADLEREAVIPAGGITVTKAHSDCQDFTGPEREGLEAVYMHSRGNPKGSKGVSFHP